MIQKLSNKRENMNAKVKCKMIFFIYLLCKLISVNKIEILHNFLVIVIFIAHIKVDT